MFNGSGILCVMPDETIVEFLVLYYVPQEWYSLCGAVTVVKFQVLCPVKFLVPCNLGKGMNPIILLPAIVGQTGLFSLGETTSLGEGKLWIQTC